MSRRSELAFIVAGAAVVALSAIVMLAKRSPKLEPIEVSQQTTYITTPTRADGWVDYPGAVDWMRRASLDAGGANAAEPLVRGLGPGVLPVSVMERDGLLKRLGIAVTGIDASALKPLRDYAAADGARGSEPSPEAAEWLRQRCPVGGEEKISFARIAGWLAQSEPALSNLQATHLARALYVPVPADASRAPDFARVDVGRFADAAQALGCRAALKLLRGDTHASFSDVTAIWQLGLLVARLATDAEYASGAAFWKAAMTGTVDLAMYPGTAPELLAGMQGDLQERGNFPPATETLTIHRLAVLAAVGTPRVAKPGAGEQPGALMARAGTGALLESINRHFDALEAAFQAKDARERIARVDQIEASTPRVAELGPPVGRGLLAVELQAASYQRLARVALRLAQRQREKESLPASLAELEGLPTDPGSGGAFGYAPSGRRFVLRGVGGDGRDDGGDPAKDVVVTANEPPRVPSP